ncbi:hypothetical protein VKT23_010899 [Stygiomarasmius scandens]|uniref:Uncharacterized protein n=1 Tax=Marasmiellus scandens TaxID=2682957 RepID=A0ABR1JAJ1_9AGAR
MNLITSDDTCFSHYFHLHKTLWGNAKASTTLQQQAYEIQDIQPLVSRVKASESVSNFSDQSKPIPSNTFSKTWTVFRLDNGSKAFLQPTGKYVTKSILIREWFETTYANMIGLAGKQRQRCFVISGGAGIGKTHFLQYILIKRLLDGKATTIQLDRDHIFWFNSDGVFVVRSWNQPDLLSSLLNDTHLIHLVDVPLAPEDVVLQAAGVMVTTSSLCDLASSYRWMDRQTPTGCILWMEPLSWEETYVVCKHFAPPFFNLQSLNDIARVFLKYGPSISTCLNLANSPFREASHERNISLALDSLKHGSRWLPLPDAQWSGPSLASYA